MSSPPLAGIRAAEFATLIAGPAAASTLAQLGAEVIKVEPLTGDPSRRLPSQSRPDGAAPAFLANNSNKKSLSIDLKSPEGSRAAQRLVDGCDVVIENYRSGVMTRLGLDPRECMERNPGLIWVTVSGYGPDGPWSRRPAIDQIIQAAAGMISTTGPAEGHGYKTYHQGIDHATANVVVQLVLASLIGRAKSLQGTWHRVSLYEVALSLQATQFADFMLSDIEPKRLGNSNPLSAPADSFPTSDGVVMIAAYQDLHYRELCRVLGRDELVEDPRFASRIARLSHREELSKEIARSTIMMSSSDLVDRLDGSGLMVSPIYTYRQVATSEEVSANRLLVDVRGDDGATYRVVRHPADRFATTGGERSLARLGQHSESVLSGLGYSAEEIARMKADGVISVGEAS